MANSEAFRWNFLSSTNPEIGRSDMYVVLIYLISVEYDIALIKLDKPVTFSKYIQPACLGIHEPKEDVKVFVSGWGITEDKRKSDILKGVQVTTYSLEKCKKMYQTPDPVEGFTSNITTRMICTLDTAKDACQGDSGGIRQKNISHIS